MGCYKYFWLLVFLLVGLIDEITCKGTITTNPVFNPEQAAGQLRQAMKGWGTDEHTLIDVLTKHNLQQRKQIAAYYERQFGESLEDEIEDETKNWFENALVGLLMDPLELAAYFVDEAIEGFGTDEKLLIAILVSFDNGQMTPFRQVYQEEHENDLQYEIKDDISEPLFEHFLITLTSYDRQQYGKVDEQLAHEDADHLAGTSGRQPTPEDFNIIFTTRSYAQLNTTFYLYKEKAKHSIEDTIKTAFSGYHKQALLAVVLRAMDPIGYYTYWLHFSMDIAGTNEDMLTWILISRSEIDLYDIRQRYNSQYWPTLESKIQDDTSSHFEKLLLKILKPY